MDNNHLKVRIAVWWHGLFDVDIANRCTRKCKTDQCTQIIRIRTIWPCGVYFRIAKPFEPMHMCWLDPQVVYLYELML